MKKTLLKLVKKMEGSVIFVGYNEDSELFQIAEKNKKITEVFTLINKGRSNGKKKLIGSKRVNIVKLQKYFKNKKFDYFICNFSIIKPFLKSFVMNNILLNNGTTYIHINDGYDMDEISYRYSRFGAEVVIIGEENDYIITINNSNAKVYKFKKYLYDIRDGWHNIIEAIAALLMS